MSTDFIAARTRPLEKKVRISSRFLPGALAAAALACGTPQGAPISPLLSNLYMRRFVLAWKQFGHEKRLSAYIVNYADDLVICCRARAEQARAVMQDLMFKLKLTVNETKTRVCRSPEEKFDFLGYTF